MNSKLYRKLDVWKKGGDDVVIIYSCFHDLASNKYCVQSADFYNIPITSKQIEEFKRQEVELFLDVAPDKRSPLFDTIEEAIYEHDKEFQ